MTPDDAPNVARLGALLAEMDPDNVRTYAAGLRDADDLAVLEDAVRMFDFGSLPRDQEE